MSLLDIALAAIVFAFTAMGMLRGVVAEGMSLTIWLGAALIAWLFADEAAPWFSHGIGDAVGQRVMAFSALFIVAFMLLAAANLVLRMAFVKPAIKPLHRALGAVLGAGRGIVVATIIVALAGLTRLPQASWWRESQAAPHLQALALSLVGHLPPDVARQFGYP